MYEGQWVTIEIGEYVFDFPQGFKLVKEQGIDSYIGRVEDDEMSFRFDLGLWTNTLADLPAEYLEKGEWKYDFLAYEFHKHNAAIKEEDMKRVEVLNIRPATKKDKRLESYVDYIAKCKLDSIVIDYTIYLPPEIKNVNFIVDTIDNHYRKIIYSKIPEEEYTGIFIRKLNDIGGLEMRTRKINSQQQKIALKILKSVRLKNGKQ
jgi:hypothetical protein